MVEQATAVTRVIVESNSGPGYTASAPAPDGPVLALLQESLQHGETDEIAWMVNRHRDEALVVNRVTGQVWMRELDERWAPVPTVVEAPPEITIARLLVHAQVTVDELAAPIRDGLVREVGVVLQTAHAHALHVLGVREAVIADRLRQVREALAAGFRQPHRIVMVVEDLEALVASFHADAEMEPGGPKQLKYRYGAAGAVQRGAGRHAFPHVYPDRFTPAEDLRVMRAGQRPGQRFAVVPC